MLYLIDQVAFNVALEVFVINIWSNMSKELNSFLCSV